MFLLIFWVVRFGVGGEVGVASSLALKIGLLDLSLKKVGEDAHLHFGIWHLFSSFEEKKPFKLGFQIATKTFRLCFSNNSSMIFFTLKTFCQ